MDQKWTTKKIFYLMFVMQFLTGCLGCNLWSKFGPVISKKYHILQKCCDDYGNKKSQKTAKNSCVLPCIITAPMITNQMLYQLS